MKKEARGCAESERQPNCRERGIVVGRGRDQLVGFAVDLDPLVDLDGDGDVNVVDEGIDDASRLGRIGGAGLGSRSGGAQKRTPRVLRFPGCTSTFGRAPKRKPAVRWMLRMS